MYKEKCTDGAPVHVVIGMAGRELSRNIVYVVGGQSTCLLVPAQFSEGGRGGGGEACFPSPMIRVVEHNRGRATLTGIASPSYSTVLRGA